jgi:hypothetical protein
VRATGAELLNFDLQKSLGGQLQDTEATRFPNGSATFSCAQRMIDIQTLSLATGADSSANGSGRMDFSRNLDLRLRMSSALAPEGAPAASFRITGPLAAPKFALPQPPPRRSR